MTQQKNDKINEKKTGKDNTKQIIAKRVKLKNK